MSCEHVEIEITSGVIELHHDETDSLIHWFTCTECGLKACYIEYARPVTRIPPRKQKR